MAIKEGTKIQHPRNKSRIQRRQRNKPRLHGEQNLFHGTNHGYKRGIKI
jgi:hypothetical protein